MKVIELPEELSAILIQKFGKGVLTLASLDASLRIVDPAGMGSSKGEMLP